MADIPSGFNMTQFFLPNKATEPAHTLQLTPGNISTAFAVLPRNSPWIRNSTAMLVAYQRKSGEAGKPTSIIESSRLWSASRVSCVTSTQHIGVQPPKHKHKEQELKRESEDSYGSCLHPPCTAGCHTWNQVVTCTGLWKECVMPGTEKCHFVWLPHREWQ